MCGIVGIFANTPDASVDETRLWEMLAPIQNRGPDGQSVRTFSGVGLGHARLSILDLDTRSDQPMLDPETGCSVTFNGEIYNFLELREELISLGYVFRTTGDTEVLLKAYEHWGTDCLSRFNGMWAFALYDPRNQLLFCSRDRLGVKPFVYALNGEQLVFASETKAILGGFPEFDTPHYAFLKHFIENGNFAGSETTFHRAIHNLLPGHYFVIRHGETPKARRYWQWEPHEERSALSFEDSLAQFKYLLTDAIRLRFRSDVPVGVCLSGGLDSSSVVALASQTFNMPISTFSCIFPQYPKIDESRYIKQVTEQFRCDAHLVEPRFPDLIPMMQQSLWEQDGPTGTPAVLSQRAVMETAHGLVTVLLDGQGADEILGGYHSYFPYSLKGLMRKFLAAPTPGNLLHYWRASKAIQKRTGKPAEKFLRTLRKAGKPVQFERDPYSNSLLHTVSPIGQDDLTTKLLEDLLYNSLPQLLHYEDRNSMAFSIESRLPFLDYRLVELMFSLPDHYKIRGATTKHLLMETMKGILPDTVLYRREKLGFATPGQQWFSDQSARLYLDQFVVKPPEALLSLDPALREALEMDWKRCKNRVPIPPNRERVLWRYFTACMWLAEHRSPLITPVGATAQPVHSPLTSPG